MDDAGSTDPRAAPAVDAGPQTLRERLTVAEAECARLEQLLEHEDQVNRRILEAQAVVEGRLAELEGVLAGTDAVRARAEAERDELKRRLTVELASREQQRAEHVDEAEGRAEALAQQLEAQAREAAEERSEHELARNADSLRIAELEQRLADELAQAAARADGLQAELKLAREDIKPRAARKLAEARAELEAECAARGELELQVAALSESQRTLGLAREHEAEEARTRIAELEQARSELQATAGERDELARRLEAEQTQLRQAERERDEAVERVAQLERAAAEREQAIEMLERTLESVSADRDRTESARRVLQSRLSARDEAERKLLADLELERRTARGQRLQLTRVERRLTEASSALAIALRRLEAAAPAPVVREPRRAAAPEAPAQPDPPARRTLLSGFLRAADTVPRRAALEVGGETYDFAGLRDRAARIAATLLRRAPQGGPQLTAVFAHRSVSAFAGVLGSMMHGHGYVPLDRTLPLARTRAMLERSQCRTIVADAESAAQLPELLGPIVEPLLVLLPDVEDVGALRRELSTHELLGARDLEAAAAWRPVAVEPSAIACLLFTSAAGGVPGGVMVTHANALQAVDVLAGCCAIGEQDRCSQLHDLTFVNAILDLFTAWEGGACVCCPGQSELLNPGRYIRDARLTVWLSVPSVALFMRRLGGLDPGSYPDLRWSLFAGEPVPVDVARAWEQAAPRSAIASLYGPVEATGAVAMYRWDAQTSPAECERGILPLGRPLPGIGVLIGDDGLREVPAGEPGDLLVSGPQVTPGYWRDPQRTRAARVTAPGHDAPYLRTGDLVRRRGGDDGPLVLLGCRDDEINVRGLRIGLDEIESALRSACGVDGVVAMGWPTTLLGADGVEAFVATGEVDAVAVRAALAAILPAPAVPRRVRGLTALPLVADGSIDRDALIRLLEAE